MPVGRSSLNTGHESTEFTMTTQKTGEDTFLKLFRNPEEAEEFKTGKKPAKGEGLDRSETMEWSQRASKPPKKDEDGNLLTHKGNVIRRGFNVA